jgi:hypothetical protein
VRVLVIEGRGLQQGGLDWARVGTHYLSSRVNPTL